MTSPFATGIVSTFPAVTGNSNVDPLLVWGYKWGSGLVGTPVTVTYSFPSVGATWIGDYWDSEPSTSFTSFSAAQKTAARQALAAWAEVANISFTEVSDTPSDVGDIRFGNSGAVTNSTSAAWAYFPYSDPNFEFPEAGDVWFDAAYAPNLQLQPGQFGYSTMLHEIGHAIGLDHPFADVPGELTLPVHLDTDQFTVMSYTAAPGTLAYASTPQLLDILAIQYIYGANMTTRTGDDVYKFSATAQTNSTIWDAGGIDTLDFSNQTYTIEINLVEGTHSRFAMQGLGATSSLLGIAYGVTIENVIGGSFHNVIDGNHVANRLVGGNDTDILSGVDGDDTLEGLGSHDNLDGGDGADELLGGSGNDQLWGGEGDVSDDHLDGGTGADYMVGGAGNDTYVINSAADQIIEEAGTDDEVLSTISIKLATLGGGRIEHATLLGAAALKAVGNASDNTLTGNDGANVLNGAGGADILIGGKGSDTYIMNGAGDQVMETVAGAAGGIDLVRSSIDFSLASLGNVENLRLLGAGAIDATGNAGNNVLTGNNGANRLDGLGGNDTMAGGKGDDIYAVDSALDVVSETVLNSNGGGIDTVESAIAFSLATRTNVENLTLTGGAHIDGTGNALGNIIRGNSGNNVLDGGTGADVLKGGAGDDLYILDHAGDVVDEEGNADLGDSVKTNAPIAAAFAGIEDYTYTGVAAWTFTADGADNTLTGGGGIDTLNGANGNDIVLGNAGNDVLTGGTGDDHLDGGLGLDKLMGGSGNDTYVIDAAGDTVDEGGNSDSDDAVISTISVKLVTLGGGEIEHATLLGTARNAVGNASSNNLTGNDGANTLNGGGGADILTGGEGSDTYIVNHAGDQVIETIAGAAGGVDLVKSTISFSLAGLANIENVTLTGAAATDATGNAGNNVLSGNNGANVLDGGAGIDTLSGGKGDDTLAGGIGTDKLTGGEGRDTFDFDSLSEAGDTIADFALGVLGDVLDIHDLLADIGYGGSDPFADAVVTFNNVGADTVVAVDADGVGAGGATTLATLTNLTLTQADTDNYLV